MTDQASAEQAQQSPILEISGGANQIGVRAYNERLVMSLVRRHGGLSKAEIARRSGLFGPDGHGDHARLEKGRPAYSR